MRVHAPGVQGCQATICMPPTTTPLKIDAVRRLGAEIELVGGDICGGAGPRADARRSRRQGLLPLATL